MSREVVAWISSNFCPTLIFEKGGFTAGVLPLHQLSKVYYGKLSTMYSTWTSVLFSFLKTVTTTTPVATTGAIIAPATTDTFNH